MARISVPRTQYGASITERNHLHRMIPSERLKSPTDYVVVDCGAPSPTRSHHSACCPECSDDEDERASSVSVDSTQSTLPTSRCHWHQRHHQLKQNMIRLLVLIVVIILVSTLLVAGLTLFSSVFVFQNDRATSPNLMLLNGNSSELTLELDSSNSLDSSSASIEEIVPKFRINFTTSRPRIGPTVTSSTKNGRSKTKKRPLTSAEKMEISRKTWELLNRNSAKSSRPVAVAEEEDEDEPENRIDRIPVPESVLKIVPKANGGGGTNKGVNNGGGGVVLPAVMVYTSANGDQPDERNEAEVYGHAQVVNNFINFKKTNATSNKNCCRSRKYMQTLHMEGCEPLQISNRICVGECLSVWVPGVFSSFPVCRPSRSHWKAVTFTCGPNRDKKKRVKVEKVRRCSCMDSNS